MEDPLNGKECPICFDEIKTKSVTATMNCCSGQIIHSECYVKSLPKCPFCRSTQPNLVPITVIHTDWRRIAHRLCACVFVSACISVAVISGQCTAAAGTGP